MGRRTSTGIPRGPPYSGSDPLGPPNDHLGIFYGTERGIFVKDVGMPIQSEVSDVRNPLSGKPTRMKRFTFK